MKRRKKVNRKKKGIENLSALILKLIRSNRSKTYNYKQIAAHLNVNDSQSRNQIIKKLQLLKSKNEIEEVERGKFKAIINSDYHTGIIEVNAKGSGYVICEAFDDDIYISSNNLNKALHLDEVEFYVFKRRRNGRLEGEVTEIIKRAKSSYVGVIQIHKSYAFVITDDKKMYKDIFIPLNKINKAEDGDKVLVDLQDWPEKASSPYGKVNKVLGKPGEHNTEIHAILADYGLPYDFPNEVLDYASSINTSITKKEIANRRDMRSDLTFTIDPKDAKDFDDALSFKILGEDIYEVGIHIADVSYYVQPDTILDEEAFERATSVYLVDRVVPMLPEVLSNYACSLRPHEEKFTFSAVFKINNKAEVIDEWFGRTVTYSDARFAYEEAQEVIETKSNIISDKVSLTGVTYKIKDDIKNAILKLNELAIIMRSQRMKSGAISFDKVEVKFNLDDTNNPTGVYFKTSKAANKLIEEFMLLANKKVAEFIGKQKPVKTFVYRVHDEPDDTKLTALQNIVSKFGFKFKIDEENTVSNALNKLLKDVEGSKSQNLVDTLAIRSMSKAEYTTQNIGHYGLAFEYYSHFTSPIRRYPDVMVHRLLQSYLDGHKSYSEDVYEDKCKHASHMEQLSTKAERDSIKYMQIKFMQDHKDEEFVGVISGVTDWGIYVEIISNKCEGMVRIRDIKDDYYEFDESQYALVGRDTKHMYQLGDEVIVTVKSTDLIKKHLDFNLIGEK
jgi:ribonuclease R